MKFKPGDIVVIPKERDYSKRYIIISCIDNTEKLFSQIKRTSCVCKAQRISDQMIIVEPEDYFQHV